MSDHERFMDAVLARCEEALVRGDCPVASLIVRDGAIVGEGQNRATTGTDPTSHADVEAIRDASRRLGTAHRHGTTPISATARRPICCWAIKDPRIARAHTAARP